MIIMCDMHCCPLLATVNRNSINERQPLPSDLVVILIWTTADNDDGGVWGGWLFNMQMALFISPCHCCLYQYQISRLNRRRSSNIYCFEMKSKNKRVMRLNLTGHSRPDCRTMSAIVSLKVKIQLDFECNLRRFSGV